jgi:hypothetical protein
MRGINLCREECSGPPTISRFSRKFRLADIFMFTVYYLIKQHNIHAKMFTCLNLRDSCEGVEGEAKRTIYANCHPQNCAEPFGCSQCNNTGSYLQIFWSCFFDWLHSNLSPIIEEVHGFTPVSCRPPVHYFIMCTYLPVVLFSDNEFKLNFIFADILCIRYNVPGTSMNLNHPIHPERFHNLIGI